MRDDEKKEDYREEPICGRRGNGAYQKTADYLCDGKILCIDFGRKRIWEPPGTRWLTVKRWILPMGLLREDDTKVGGCRPHRAWRKLGRGRVVCPDAMAGQVVPSGENSPMKSLK